ncbi:Thioesterase/thiol ester dehydrase-isomerase [Whalleya microplaca]|nr:Thioesterase/thiol ester dehydrase-isomerase [Whalleya microplaca]
MSNRGHGSGKGGVFGALQRLEGIERVEKFLEWAIESYKDPENHEWMTTIIPHLTIVSYSASLPHPSITFRFTVQPIHCNGLKNLHGGCTSTIFDSCTTMPLHFVSRPGYWAFLGVSRTLNVTYLRPIPVGTTVNIKCDIVQVGRKLCTLRGEMRAVGEDGKEGPVVAVCEHGKVNTDPPVEKL